MNFKRYHVSKNLLSEKYENRSINGVGAFTIDSNYDLWIGEVVAGQTYAISNMNYVYGFFTAKPLPNTGATYDGSCGYETSGAAVVTVPSGCTWIAVRVLHNADNAMCNAGSQPLPYEPYSSEVWHDIPHYIMGTSTDTITTPAVIYANGTTATIGLKGDMYQASGVSPTTPIQPQECGERTGNLAYKIIKNANISPEGLIATTSGYNIMVAKVAQGQAYSGTGYVYAFFNDEPDIRSTSYNESRVVNNFKNVTAPISGYVAVRYAPSENPMLNSGSTPLPYEPYGYKIPISSANTTTNIYLGEVESTRQIYKYVYTGSETWNVGTENFYSFVPQTYGEAVPYSAVICSHSSGSTINNTGKAVFLKKSEYPTITTGAELKQYCADQYSAGTPVTVWYILATPTTGIVNEPLRKIGDYADTISMEQAGVQIPTLHGNTVIDVETTLKPSEVSLTYTGWHDAEVKEWDGSEWQ